MVFTNIGKSGTANLLGSRLIYCSIGSGSGANLSTRSGLIAPLLTKLLTGSPDLTLTNEATNTFDFSSVEMSGITLKEFGGTDVSGTTPQVWNIEAFAGNSVLFDGTNELQVQITYENV